MVSSNPPARGFWRISFALLAWLLRNTHPYRKPLGEPAPQASNLALAVVLLVVIFLQAIFNAWQDFSTSRVMSSIKGMLPADVVVLRDGKQLTVPAAALVPGDVVQISLGQKVPADVKLIDVSGDLRFDRSVLTGEVRLSAPLQISPPSFFWR